MDRRSKELWYPQFLPTALQDRYLENDYSTDEALMITWDEIINDKHVISHLLPLN